MHGISNSWHGTGFYKFSNDLVFYIMYPFLPQEEQLARMKAEKIRIALEKIKDAKIRKVRGDNCQELSGNVWFIFTFELINAIHS